MTDPSPAGHSVQFHIFDSTWMPDGWLVYFHAQSVEKSEHVINGLETWNNIERHWQRAVFPDVLHVQLTTGKLPLRVSLGLDEIIKAN